jgi:hypothetical protein
MTQDLIHCLEPTRRGKGSPRRINAGKLTDQKPALKMKEVWAIRARFELRHDVRELALFNVAIDSKLCGCDLVRLKVGDVAAGGEVKNSAIIVQRKTGTPVQVEVRPACHRSEGGPNDQTRRAACEWIRRDQVGAADYLFRSRLSMSDHLPTRQYARIVQAWVRSIGLNPAT